MAYFILPKINKIITEKEINLEETENDNEIFIINETLRLYINNIKEKINNSLLEWDIYKKYTNPYEYIHTPISYNIKNSISKIKTLSRSFYKMIEIMNTFDILKEYKNTNIKTFHLAEGPGGFIEAVAYIRKNNLDKYYGMTLISDDDNIPSWKKTKQFLEKNPNVIIENGKTNTGDLFSKTNLLYCLEKYNNSMDIITGDGGFDFSLDFNKQEQISTKLIFAQICFALAMQKEGGYFILKIFDSFSSGIIELLYMLSNYYEKVYIMKPNTSRIANSEKYIICKNFRLNNTKILVNKLSNYFNIFNNNNFIKHIIRKKINYYYIIKIEEINAIFGQQQIENINHTFSLIKTNSNNNKIEIIKKQNIDKSIFWCEKHNIPYNKI